MTRGPKKKPDAEKKAKGTFRPSRGQPGASDEPLAELIAPDRLPEAAKVEWETVRPELEGIVTAAEVPMLGVYCCLVARFYEGELSGEPMKSPEVARMHALAAAFGLLPAERTRRPKKQEKKADSPFEGM